MSDNENVFKPWRTSHSSSGSQSSERVVLDAEVHGETA